MAVLRAAVGFMTFLLAFEFRGGEEGVPMEGTGRASGVATGLIRDQDIIFEDSNLENLFKLENFPVFMGCMDNLNPQDDLYEDFILDIYHSVYASMLICYTCSKHLTYLLYQLCPYWQQI